ncbi:MAG: vitamin K epoxide reductase family protein [Acidobacteria bacterium]|nr:vitamin K epoxide reductase family protein [Acidobacteriota bacterium]
MTPSSSAPLRAASHGRWTSAIAALAIAGVLVSAISLYQHFSTTKTSFCDIGDSFNCDLVNRSAYSTVFGVPVALIALFGYLLLFSLATIYREKAETPLLLAIASLLGMSLASYLTYIEARVLRVWCILCLSSLALILAIAIVSAVMATKSSRSS